MHVYAFQRDWNTCPQDRRGSTKHCDTAAPLALIMAENPIMICGQATVVLSVHHCHINPSTGISRVLRSVQVSGLGFSPKHGDGGSLNLSSKTWYAALVASYPWLFSLPLVCLSIVVLDFLRLPIIIFSLYALIGIWSGFIKCLFVVPG